MIDTKYSRKDSRELKRNNVIKIDEKECTLETSNLI